MAIDITTFKSGDPLYVLQWSVDKSYQDVSNFKLIVTIKLVNVYRRVIEIITENGESCQMFMFNSDGELYDSRYLHYTLEGAMDEANEAKEGLDVPIEIIVED